MSEKEEPRSFAVLLHELGEGSLLALLSSELQEVVNKCQDYALSEGPPEAGTFGRLHTADSPQRRGCTPGFEPRVVLLVPPTWRDTCRMHTFARPGSRVTVGALPP